MSDTEEKDQHAERTFLTRNFTAEEIMKFGRAHLILSVLALFGLNAGNGFSAQPYPEPGKVIRFIVPYPPGGNMDIVGRIVAQEMAESFSPAIVENKAGAGGSIGATIAAKAPPDGYTLFVGSTGTILLNPLVIPNLPIDPVKDFAPISNFASSPYVLLVGPSMEAKDLHEMISLAKAKPGELNYASFGVGSSGHLASEMLNAAAKVNIRHIPYKGGAQAMTDLLGGQVDMLFNLLPAAMPYIKSGRLRALAVASETRHPTLPDVPTFSEAGVPGFKADAWFGFFAPAGTPRHIVSELNREINRILALPKTKEKLAALGADARGNSPDKFAEELHMEAKLYGKIAKDAGVTAK